VSGGLLDDSGALRSNMPEEPVYRITLVRHCESVGNADGKVQGHADSPLSERGRAQARALARRWQTEGIAFDHVITSPLVRARETAAIIAAPMGFAHPEIDSLWMEHDSRAHPVTRLDEPTKPTPQPGDSSGEDPAAARGESDEALFLRGRRALQSILERPPARYLAVSHRAILNTIVCAILDIGPRPGLQPAALFRLANGSISRFRYFPLAGRWQADVIGDRSHWKFDA